MAVSLLMVAGLAYTLPVLNGLEFFRHTEADRALIAWEMLQNGDFIVPHLLGDRYLTKPPLFYWLIAATFSAVGEPYEWAARLPSALAATLLISIQYLGLRALKLEIWQAVFGSLILATTGEFFLLSVQAEIDMLYTLLCTTTFYLWFCSVFSKHGLKLAICSYISLGLAFLAKGPPILIFFGIGALIFIVLRGSNLRQALAYQMVGLAFFLMVVSCWLVPFLFSVPISALKEVLNQEYLVRFVEDPLASKRDRGLFFYLGSIPVGLLPWSLVFGVALYLKMARGTLEHRVCSQSSEAQRLRKSFLIYALCVTLPALLVFSLASGKASRYLFPLYPLLVSAMTIVMSPFFSLCLFKRILLTLLALMFAARIPYLLVYAQERNAKLSVKQAVSIISESLPSDATLYTVELIDRWIVYYLVREKRKVLRITPALSRTLKDSSLTSVYLLLSKKFESWRVEQRQTSLPALEVVTTIKAPRHEYLLVKVPGALLEQLNPQDLFPTNYSVPPKEVENF